MTTTRTSLTPVERRRRLAAARAGGRDILPMVVGVVPFGLAIGATLSTSSLSVPQAVFSAVGILAGAAQLTTITLLEQGAAPVAIVVSALIINCRLLLYGAVVSTHFTEEPRRRRLLVAAFVIDQTLFTCVPRFERGGLSTGEKRAYWLAAGAMLASSFVAAQLVAMIGGGQLPLWTGLHIAAPLALVGLAATSITDGKALSAALAAGLVAVAAVGLPFQLSIVAAIAAGVGTGLGAGWRPAARPEGVRA